MDIYLPVAEMSVNLFLLLGIGGGVGFLSGVFGVGGGFLMTPMLLFIGIPATVAVGTQALQILSSSISGVLAQMRRGAVDRRMGLVLVAGGFMGSGLGILLFHLLQRLGQIDSAISLSYVLLLGIVGTLMLVEGLGTFLRGRRGGPARKSRLHQHFWLHGLPFKLRFPKSRLYISVGVPVVVGMAVGVLSAIMGVGGGFIMIPAMIYLIGMPTGVVVGTSLFQVCFVAALTAFLHATTNQTVDIILGLILTAGGVVGAQFGAQFGARLRGEQVRLLLACLVLLVALKLGYDLIVTPADPYSLAS
ncbi:MAG: sulfite exporter TauE/SafE family protein [Geminicoccaceae bacterium]|nr:sulfite exporter TauE/SafE family protein [Geminicoccaceae bacterium]